MRRKIFTIILSLIAFIGAKAQDPYTEILGQIEINSTTLAALREQTDARKLENKTGLSPSDPEVEFGYLWGNPSSIGGRKDVSIEQQLDFPTVYSQRNRLSKLKNEGEEYLYAAKRMEIILRAKTLLIEMTYYNSLSDIYNRQLEGATHIAEAYERMLEKGEASQLDNNKARLNLVHSQRALREISAEIERINAELKSLNGGKEVVFTCKSFSTTPLPQDFDSWYEEMEEANPALRYLKSQVEVRERQVKLSKQSGLPKLSLGYMGEFVEGENYQGITFGFSIPLWENKGKVRQAKSEVVVSRLEEQDAKVAYYANLKALYLKATNLQETINGYREALGNADSRQMLIKALESGEISIIEYVRETDYYLEAAEKLLAAQRDLELTMAELCSAML